MEGFLYQIEREDGDKNILLKGFYIDENGCVTQKDFELPYIVNMREEHFESLQLEPSKFWRVRSNLKNFNEEDVVQIEIESKEVFDNLLTFTKDRQIPLYERDLNPIFRPFIDGKIQIYDGEKYRKNSSKYIKNFFEVLSLDIETLGRDENLRVGMVSCYSSKKSVVYVDCKEINMEKLSSYKPDDVSIVFCRDEEELLKKLQKDVISLSPHIIIGWNVIGFDFAVLKQRFETYKIPFSFSSVEGYSMKVSKGFFSRSYLSFPKVLVLDGIQVLRSNFILFEEYNLNFVSSKVLGENKISLGDGEDEEDKGEKIERYFKENPQKLIRYAVKDSALVYKIFEKLELIELMISRSIITTTPLEKIFSPIACLDIMYLQELHKQKRIANSTQRFSSDSHILGGFVFNPEKNFYNDVFVFDFKSFYPNVMITFNIDPLSFISKKDVGNIPKIDYIVTPNDVFLSKNEAILPKLIKQLAKERELAKGEGDLVKSHAIKITMNSFFGALGTPKCRFYNKGLAEAITSFAQLILKKSKEFVDTNFEAFVIYGDTDSIFVRSKNKFNSLSEKKKFGKSLEKQINDYFKKWIEDEFGVKSCLEIEFERLYSSFFIASKKRYAGFNELTQKEEFVGIELVRGDWTTLAREFQQKILKMCFSNSPKKNIEKYILSTIEKLKKGKLDDKLVYKKSITKPLSQYTKTTPPHVKAAREVENFNLRLVKYIMTTQGPKHISLFDCKKHSYDYNHYIEKQLKGVSSDVLEVLKIDFDELVLEKKQKKLDVFFR